MLTTLTETDYSDETERCCALLEAVLNGLRASNCQAVADRPDWETEMAKPSRREVSFTALLEQVKGEFKVLAEGLADLTKRVGALQQDVNDRIDALDMKIDRVTRTLTEGMDKGFATLMTELHNHRHADK